MGKALIIAEKPSVASDIAKALGGFTKHDEYFESDRYVLSSAVGHLLEICAPENYEVKRGKWSFANLPVIPPEFALRPIEKSEPRLKVLLKLLKRKDIDSLINACDAGREGELIFRYIVQHAKTDKPIQRLWLQSMTPAAIREGFASLRDGKSLQPLADAAVCRSESDWLVGINGTRAMTAFNSKSGGFQLTTVGRVQTPTLAIMVEREEKIKGFVSKDYWEVHGTFLVGAGNYIGRWFDEKFVRKEGESDLKAERIWSREQAEGIRAKCLGKPGIVTEESKPSTQLSPLLFDLTSLQREANSRFGYPARRTLQIAQALYERHKVLTYPRTDSRALPEDYVQTAKDVLGSLQQAGTGLGQFAGQVLSEGWVRPNKRIFNNAKVSDHFAIIPTTLAPKNLEGDEAKLYDFVARRFLAVFYPAAEFQITSRITRVENEPFKSEGKILVNPGWMVVYGRETETEDSPNLAPVQPNENATTESVDVHSLQTKPPARFSEATLLSAMEGAGKLVEDEELREAMSAKGLGTPATRAAIIEGLIHEQYIQRNGRELQATAKGISLITLLRGLGIPELCSPELTGNWEFKLKQMERGELPRPEFMKQIAEMTRQIVDKTKQYESDTVPGNFATLQSRCPKCGAVMKETYKKYQCTTCDFSLWKIVAGRQFEVPEIEQLLTERKLGPLQGFKSKLGRPFAAIVKLTPELKAEFDFGQNENNADGTAQEVDFSGQEPLGPCPKCGGNVYESGMNYICEKAVGKGKKCDFRTGKIILQRNIEPEQVRKLLANKRTDLLQKFISKKGRPFSAFLVVGDGGKIGFEFAPRVARDTKTAAGKRKAKPAEPVAESPAEQEQP
ncbi:MAG: DNA topoisomerase III [Verrucomicrobiota bacterium]|nr:DNA topoisomerase III [Verrucomicrobiota bacterium]